MINQIMISEMGYSYRYNSRKCVPSWTTEWHDEPQPSLNGREEEPLTGWPIQSLSGNNYYIPYTSNILI